MAAMRYSGSTRRWPGLIRRARRWSWGSCVSVRSCSRDCGRLFGRAGKSSVKWRSFSAARHLFFPLTPVGLDGRGETDLSLRTISPFGMLEPLVWLLEMNGYSILK